MESKVELKNLKGRNVVTGVDQDAQVHLVFNDGYKVATIAWYSDKLQFDKATDPLIVKHVVQEVSKTLDRKVVAQFPPNVPDWVFNNEESIDEQNDDFDT